MIFSIGIVMKRIFIRKYAFSGRTLKEMALPDHSNGNNSAGKGPESPITISFGP
jgi:hypothetical protein